MGKQRKHIRLRDHDYRMGSYFVTFVTRERERFLGEVLEGEVVLSEIGRMAESFWLDIPDHFPKVDLDEFVIMPNHVHGILHLSSPGDLSVRTPDLASLRTDHVSKQFGPPVPGALSTIISQYKAAVTRWCRKNGHEHFAWHGRYHDRLIRDQSELERIRKYIALNPSRWDEDDYF
jgi:putative transposase